MLIDLLIDEIDESGWKWKMMMMTMTPESYTRPFYVLVEALEIDLLKDKFEFE